MGYLTNYSLVIGKTFSLDIIKELRNYSSGAMFSLMENGDTSEATKWYYHEKELRRFSKKYPDALFTLSGEDNGDLWKKYFKNGKMQICNACISYPPFDEKELE